MAEAGKGTPIIPDVIDDYYLNPVWKGRPLQGKTIVNASPFGTGTGRDDDDDDDEEEAETERPQLDDIQRPVQQEVYYVNGVARVKLFVKIFISSENDVKRFRVTKSLTESEGGRS